jgi:hypothetical protein
MGGVHSKKSSTFCPYFPQASGAGGAVSDDQTRFDPTDPLIEQGIGWRLHTLDLRPALPISTISTSNTQYLADVENYSGIVLEKVAEYFYYNWRNRDAIDVPDMDIPPELCLELLMAADYLDSEFVCFRLGNLIADSPFSMTSL